MLYEIRVYEAAPGQADAMRDRFKKEVVPRMPSHGIELVGAFVAPIEDGQLTYITRYSDEAARKAAWESFAADSEWKAIKTASEVNGPLLAKQTVSVLDTFIPGLPLA